MKSSQRPATLFGTSGSMCFLCHTAYMMHHFFVGMLSDVLHVLLVFRSLGSHIFVEFPYIVQVSNETSLCCLGFKGDCTTQLSRGYNKPL